MKGTRSTGFTLVELLITIAIIVVLASLVTVGVMSAKQKTIISTTKTQLDGIRTALTMYESDNGVYPYGDGNGPSSKTAPKSRDDSGNAKMVMALLGIDENGNKVGTPYWSAKEQGLGESVSIPGAKVALDGWKVPFIYRSACDEDGNERDNIHNPDSYDIYSCGPNMIDDGGKEDDIGNW